MPDVLFRVACLLQRTQHEVREDALHRRPFNLLRQLLVHARRDMHVFGDLDWTRLLARTTTIAALSAGLEPFYFQCAHAERKPKSRGQVFKIEDALGIGLL